MSYPYDNKKVNFQKLENFGFKKKGDKYFYSTFLLDKQFKLDINITLNGEIYTKVFDNETDDMYTLHLAESAVGPFVGQIKKDYESFMKNILDECYEHRVFKSDYAQKVIDYVNNKYDDELEYLWEKFPNNAICRRKDNSKWYLLVLTVSKNKLGFESQNEIEIIDIREEPEIINTIVDNNRYFAGYHMNKKHWLTIILDGSIPFEEIQERIDKSYNLAKNK